MLGMNGLANLHPESLIWDYYGCSIQSENCTRRLICFISTEWDMCYACVCVRVCVWERERERERVEMRYTKTNLLASKDARWDRDSVFVSMTLCMIQITWHMVCMHFGYACTKNLLLWWFITQCADPHTEDCLVGLVVKVSASRA